MSADGSGATAVWISSDGACNNILTASATIEGNVADWGTPVTLTDCVSGQDAETPAIGLSADGSKAVAAWGKQLPGGSAARVESKSATITENQGDWAPDTVSPTIIQVVGGVSPRPDIAVAADGSAAVLSFATNAGDQLIPARVQSIATIMASIDGSDAYWQNDVSYVSGDGSQATGNDNSVALTPDGGRAVAVFTQDNGSGQRVFAASATVTRGVAATDPPVSSWGAEEELPRRRRDTSQQPRESPFPPTAPLPLSVRTDFRQPANTRWTVAVGIG